MGLAEPVQAPQSTEWHLLITRLAGLGTTPFMHLLGGSRGILQRPQVTILTTRAKEHTAQKTNSVPEEDALGFSIV